MYCCEKNKKNLGWFLEVFGSLLNNHKCCIYGWNTSTIILQCISQILDVPFKENLDHFKHSGLPISKDNMKLDIWTSSINKMKKKN